MATYARVEDVKTALDSKATARDDARILRAIRAASADADAICQRGAGAFRPRIETRYFDWPPRQTSSPSTLWLDANGLISVSALTSGGVTIPSTDYYLEPSAYGPPYTRIDIDTSSSSTWSPGDSSQRAIGIAGLWAGCPDEQEAVGTLGGSINASVTALAVSDGSKVGVGDQLLIGTERLDVTARTWHDPTVTINGAMTASAAGTTLPLATPSNVKLGEVVLVEAERMLVVDVTATTVTVIRAWDGSTLAAHNSATAIYVNRALTVTRDAFGSTAASHTAGDAVTRHVVPGDVEALVVASSLSTVLAEQAGYRTEGSTSGSTSKPGETTPGAGLAALRERVAANHGRRNRTRVV